MLNIIIYDDSSIYPLNLNKLAFKQNYDKVLYSIEDIAKLLLGKYSVLIEDGYKIRLEDHMYIYAKKLEIINVCK